jgi:predicted ATPase
MKIDAYLKQMMPDFLDIKNRSTREEYRNLVVQFSNSEGSMTLPLEELSDAEKCFMICALTIAANDGYGPLLCFWDEPDNFLAPSEVGHSVMALRRAFQDRGQLIVTSHSPEAIRRFSDESTLVLHRNSHLEPTIVRSVEDIRTAGSLKGDFVDALLRGDVDR